MRHAVYYAPGEAGTNWLDAPSPDHRHARDEFKGGT
jgi:hypothetical protein